MAIAQEEVFGPVLSIIPFDTEEQAIMIANDTKYGLASGVWTTNLSRAMRVSRAIHAGTIWVNTYRASSVMAPFGGFKESGFGKERGVNTDRVFGTYRTVVRLITRNKSMLNPVAVFARQGLANDCRGLAQRWQNAG